MKSVISTPLPVTPKRPRFVPALLASALASALTLAAPARAADWYLSASQVSPANWTKLTAWKSAADGSGASPSAFSASDSYSTNNKLLRSPEGTTDATFPGGLLKLSGSAGVLALKTASPAAAIVPLLQASGGKIENNNGGVTRLNVGRLDAVSGSTMIASLSGRTVNLTVTGALVGAGELRVAGAGSTARLSVSDALAYTGRLFLTAGTLDFDAPWSSSGALVIEGGVLVLDQPVTVTALTINGIAYAPGTHDHAAIAAKGHSAYVTGSGGSITVAPPTTWYLSLNQIDPGNWETLSAWKSNANGTGTSPTAIRAADTFDLNGFDVRTWTGQVSDRFGGGVIVSDSGGSDIVIKTTGGARSTIPHLRTIGTHQYPSSGRLLHNTSGVVYVRIDHFETVFGTYTLTADSSNNRTLDVSVGRLSGPGGLSLVGGGKFQISIEDATACTGKIAFGSGTFDFNRDLSSTGTLELGSLTKLVLDQTITVTGLTIAGVVKPVATYTLADLQAQHPGMTFTGTSTGAIVVRPPATWHLSTTQGAGDWNTLAHWNSASDGSGLVAPSVNAHDNYVNQVAGRVLRTPDTSATFAGGSLVLASSAKLHLRAPAGQVATIPALDTSGAVTITNNGTVAAEQALVVTDWNIGSGLTTLSVPSTETLTVSVDTLSGTGTLQSQTSGNYRYAIRDGSKFTGTLRHYSGVLTFAAQLGTNGPLVVDSGAKLILEKPGFFTSIKLGATFLAPGHHSYASLRAAHGAYFPAGGDPAAFLAVHAPDTAGPVQMFGINIAGAEFTPEVIPGTHHQHYFYPSEARVQYAHSKGVKLIRIPFRWERVQRTLGADLYEPDMVLLDTSIGYAAARGMKVVLDMHNYAHRRAAGSNTPEVLIGTGSITYASFADVWRKLANRYKGNATIWGYGIMNEPKSTGGTWSVIAQTAINAIREKDLTHHVLVGGDGWSNARNWGSLNRNLVVSDPVGRLIYEAHCYFDSNNDGVYGSYDTEGGSPTLGVERVREFVEWLEARGARGFLGEYGVPYNDSRWLPTLNNFLAYLHSNGLSGTYWATGPWPASDLIHCEPANGVDRPQWSVLDDYVDIP